MPIPSLLINIILSPLPAAPPLLLVVLVILLFPE